MRPHALPALVRWLRSQNLLVGAQGQASWAAPRDLCMV